MIYWSGGFVHIGINPRAIQFSWHHTVEKYLNDVGDWYRYAAQNYVVWTRKSPAEISQGIVNLPGLQAFYVLATPFEHPRTNGMMPKEFWAWFNKPRT